MVDMLGNINMSRGKMVDLLRNIKMSRGRDG